MAQARSPVLRLCPDHIARIHRSVEDQGPPPGMVLQTDADYADWVARVMQANPAPRQPIRLFAYGSLIWKPEIDHVAAEPATAHCWHRSFCLKMPRFRGTPDNPGLMMVLDRGGQCRGMLFTLPATDPATQLDRLFRREFTFKPINNIPRWISVQTATGPQSALAFVVNRASPLYAGRMALDDVATVLSRACGHWGTGAEYLMYTVQHLFAHGIRDRRLWALQELVAARIEAATGPVPPLRP
jgi:glutathione-specific gamma-glutamylcyclotransferase